MDYLIWLALVLSVTQFHCVSAKVIQIPFCGPEKFYCPDDCSITWMAGCPKNCNCRKFVRCPPVSCPADEPICSIHTLLDGCQTCACKLPYAIIEKDGEPGEEPTDTFVFLNPRDYRRQLDDRSKTHNQKIVSEHTCTLTMMDKIDRCMEDMMDTHRFTQSRRRDDVLTINPMLKPDKGEMEKMCGMMGNSLKCMGERMYNECRHSHPHLAEMDAIYGYPCGPKQHLFFDHMDCIQGGHERSYRLLACEDQATRTMGHIQLSKESREVKQKKKCDAMTWLMKCEEPAISRHCSSEAMTVFTEAMAAATDYMAPECSMDLKRSVFVVRNETDRTGKNNQLAPKEVLQCSTTQQEEVEKHLGRLHREILKLRDRASLSYPMGYWYRHDRLRRVCKEYKRGMSLISTKTKQDCYKRDDVYDMVHFTLFYPCGYATRSYFLRYFPCLTTVRRTEEVRICEFLAHQRLEDPSNDVCETYNILAECMYPHVISECSVDAMELEYQYLGMIAEKHSPECQIRRKFIPGLVKQG